MNEKIAIEENFWEMDRAEYEESAKSDLCCEDKTESDMCRHCKVNLLGAPSKADVCG